MSQNTSENSNKTPERLSNASVNDHSRVEHPTGNGVSTANTLETMSPQGSATSSATQPVGLATARWFGMLAGDAELETEIFPPPRTPAAEDFSLLGVHGSAAEVLDISPEQQSNIAFPISQSETEAQGPLNAHTAEQGATFSEKALWRSPDILVLQPHEQFLFENFVNRISRWIDLFDPHRHFSTLVPRLALYNVGLLNAILTLSARHLSLNTGLCSERPLSREDALGYYHETLHYIQRAMQYKSYNTSLELLATTLIISSYEMLDGSSRDWERHLQGVFWIQRSQVIHGDSKGLRAAVWWAWLCQDFWAAFRDKRKVFTFWKPERLYYDMNPWELAARSVFLMGKVVNYCAQVEDPGKEHDAKSRLDMATVLTAMLDEWQSNLTPEFAPLPYTAKTPICIFEPIWIHPQNFGKAHGRVHEFPADRYLAASVQLHFAARILLSLHWPMMQGPGEFMKHQASLSRYVNIVCGIATVLDDYDSSIMSAQCLYIGKSGHFL